MSRTAELTLGTGWDRDDERRKQEESLGIGWEWFKHPLIPEAFSCAVYREARGGDGGHDEDHQHQHPDHAAPGRTHQSRPGAQSPGAHAPGALRLASHAWLECEPDMSALWDQSTDVLPLAAAV